MNTVTERYIDVTKVSSATQPNNGDFWVVLLSGNITSKAKESITYYSQISMHYATLKEALSVKVGDKVTF